MGAGNDNVTLSAAIAAAGSLKMGECDDTVTVNEIQTTKTAGAIDGVAGDNDKLVFTDTTFVADAEVWTYGNHLPGKAHPGSDLDLIVRTLGALLRPCLAVEARRTALRESDIPIFVDVHDWALLPEASQKEIAARFLPLR